MELKPNMVFRYDAGSWCRHGLAITRMCGEKLIATDSYWRDPQMDWVDLPRLHAGLYLGDLDEFRKSNRDEMDRYADEDTIYFPIGGTSEQCWIRQSAKPDRKRAEDQLKYKVECEKSTIRTAQRSLERLEKELAQLHNSDDDTYALDPPGWEGGFAPNH